MGMVRAHVEERTDGPRVTDYQYCFDEVNQFTKSWILFLGDFRRKIKDTKIYHYSAVPASIRQQKKTKENISFSCVQILHYEESYHKIEVIKDKAKLFQSLLLINLFLHKKLGHHREGGVKQRYINMNLYASDAAGAVSGSVYIVVTKAKYKMLNVC